MHTDSNLLQRLSNRFVSWDALIAILVCLLPVVAKPAQTLTDSQVQPAALNRTEPRPTAQTVRFTRRSSQSGDVIEQQINHSVRMTTAWRRGNLIVKTTDLATESIQRRTITTTRVDQGRATAVRVAYVEAAKHRQDSGSFENPPEAVAQPTHGKTYLCQRDGEKLVITDEEGRVPPPEELDLVASDMEAIGRPNPLVEYLADRSVAVGQALSLPLAQADRLLGLRAEFGKLTRFDLTQREVRIERDVPCAVFDARIEAKSSDSSQMHLQVSGPIVVEVDSCRARSSKLAGPIALSESRGSYSAPMQLISTGRITLNLASLYRDAAP
jgi:hypothetical protein